MRFGDRHTLRVCILRRVDPEILYVAVVDSDANGIRIVACGVVASIDGCHTLPAVERAAGSDIALPTREGAQKSRCRAVDSRGVLRFSRLDGPAATADRNAGERRRIAGFQATLCGSHTDRADCGKGQQARREQRAIFALMQSSILPRAGGRGWSAF